MTHEQSKALLHRILPWQLNLEATDHPAHQSSGLRGIATFPNNRADLMVARSSGGLRVGSLLLGASTKAHASRLNSYASLRGTSGRSIGSASAHPEMTRPEIEAYLAVLPPRATTSAVCGLSSETREPGNSASSFPSVCGAETIQALACSRHRQVRPKASISARRCGFFFRH